MEIIFINRPENLEVNLVVGVADKIAKVADLSPLNICKLLFPLFGNVSRGFAQYFKKSLECGAGRPIGSKYTNFFAI